MGNPSNASGDDFWLKEENPDLYYLVHALQGDPEAGEWLEARSSSMSLFAKAAGGDRDALSLLRRQEGDMDDLVGLVGLSNGHTDWLRTRHPALYQLFEAIQGDRSAMRELHQSRLDEVARVVRPAYQKAQLSDTTQSASQPTTRFDEGEAADVGCLVGEMHLRNGEYIKAIEAFSRALDGTPSADALEGRARAYRALAERDLQQARQMR
jgi:hypothetical protein